MIALLRALHAERLKLRSTLALWLCVLAPLVVVLFGTLIVWSNPVILPNKAASVVRWQAFVQSVMVTWSMMMLPLFITLEAALLTELDHGNHQWKHLLALPLPRKVHYLTKLFMLVALVLFATLILCVLIPAAGLLLTLTANPLLSNAPPWGFLFGHALANVAAAMLMLALQLFIAIRWRSFSLTMATGITASMIAIFIPKSGLFGELFPWAMPAMAISGTSDQLTLVVALGLIGFCVVGALSALDFSRREQH